MMLIGYSHIAPASGNDVIIFSHLALMSLGRCSYGVIGTRSDNVVNLSHDSHLAHFLVVYASLNNV